MYVEHDTRLVFAPNEPRNSLNGGWFVQPNGREHCWNARKSLLPGYWAQDGVFQASIGPPTGIKWVWVPHRMTTECQQPGKGFKPIDGCIGCKDLKQ